MPPALASLLHHTRVGILMLLLVVLPLHSVAQLIHGLQGTRHVHTQAGPLAVLAAPVLALLDELNAAQDRGLAGATRDWGPGRDAGAGLHAHGGVLHQHDAGTAGVLDVGDAADGSLQGGATAFLAWLPTALAVPAGDGGARPLAAAPTWRDRAIAPPLTPPRG